MGFLIVRDHASRDGSKESRLELRVPHSRRYHPARKVNHGLKFRLCWVLAFGHDLEHAGQDFQKGPAEDPRKGMRRGRE